MTNPASGFLASVKHYMDSHRVDYDTAWAQCRELYPHLFAPIAAKPGQRAPALENIGAQHAARQKLADKRQQYARELQKAMALLPGGPQAHAAADAHVRRTCPALCNEIASLSGKLLSQDQLACYGIGAVDDDKELEAIAGAAGPDPDEPNHPAMFMQAVDYNAVKDGIGRQAAASKIRNRHPALAQFADEAARKAALANAAGDWRATPTSAFLRPLTQAAAGDYPDTRGNTVRPDPGNRPAASPPPPGIVKQFTDADAVTLGLTAASNQTERLLAYNCCGQTLDRSISAACRASILQTLIGYTMAAKNLSWIDAESDLVRRYPSITPPDYGIRNFANTNRS